MLHGGDVGKHPRTPLLWDTEGEGRVRRLEARLGANIIPVAFILQRQTAELAGHLLMT